MRGEISETTVPAICRSLASQSATGRLVLVGPEGTGTITFRSGAITDASSPLPRARLKERLTGGGHLDELTVARVVHELRDGAPEGSAGTSPDDASLARGLLERALADHELVERMLIAPVIDALVMLFARRAGEYRFEAVAPTEHGAEASGVHIEVEPALVEVTRRSEQVADLPAVARSPDTIPLLLLDLPATPLDLVPDTLTVLTGIDDHRTLGEIAHRIGYGMFDVSHAITGLYERGVVALTRPQAGFATQGTQAAGPVQVGVSRATDARQVGPSTPPTTDHGRARTRTADPDGTTADPDGTTADPDGTADALDGTTPSPSGRDDRAAGSTPSSTAAQPPGQPDLPLATNAAVPRRSDAAGDTDVSEFLRELSSLANRDDTRGTTTNPSAAPADPRRGRHDPTAAETGDGPPSRAETDDEVEDPDGQRHRGSTPTSDDGRRRRRGFFGRG